MQPKTIQFQKKTAALFLIVKLKYYRLLTHTHSRLMRLERVENGHILLVLLRQKEMIYGTGYKH